MSEQIWYVYQNSQQLGPFTAQQIKQLFDSSMISQDAYLFKVGWKNWMPLEDCADELQIKAQVNLSTPQRRIAAPRATINGRVIVHNNGQLTIGKGVNISASGIFVETSDEIFTVGELLKLSVRCDGLARPFNVTAKVIRFSVQPNLAKGYGLQFENLDPDILREIDTLVKRSAVPTSKHSA